MDRKTKISVGFILMLGALGSICAVARLGFLRKLAMSNDFFLNATNISLVSTIEPALGIIASSLATFRPLFKIIATQARRTIAGRSPYDSRRRLSRSYAKSKSLNASSLNRSRALTSDQAAWESMLGQGTSQSRTTTTCIGGKSADIRDNDDILARLNLTKHENKSSRSLRSFKSTTSTEKIWANASEMEKGSWGDDVVVSRTVDVDVSYVEDDTSHQHLNEHERFHGPSQPMPEFPEYPSPAAMKRSLSCKSFGKR